jgi:hypothetical protein
MPFFVMNLVFGLFATATNPFSIKSAREAIWTETHNRVQGWLRYRAESYRASGPRSPSEMIRSFVVSFWQRRADF